MGLNESASEKKERLVKRKFSSTLENAKKGINKRYIVTENKTDEYKKDRWSKLATFNRSETIKEAEELNSVFDNINESDYFEFSSKNKNLIRESKKPSNEPKEIVEEKTEKTVDVEKEGSAFGITYKFYEKDFLNENKSYILDLNSNTFVINPNLKK